MSNDLNTRYCIWEFHGHWLFVVFLISNFKDTQYYVIKEKMLIGFLTEIIQEDQYHSHSCTINMQLEPGLNKTEGNQLPGNQRKLQLLV